LHRHEQAHLRDAGREERRSLFDDPARLRHIRNVFTRTDDVRTFAYFGTDDELIGYRTCFQDRRTLLSWNSAYRPDFERYRIGKVLQYDILEHLYDQGEIDVFDFGAGRYPWKFEWTDDFVSTYRLRLTAKAPEQKQSGAVGVVPDERAPTKPLRPEEQVVSHSTSARLGRAVARIKRPLARPRDLDRHAPVIWYVPHPDDETIFMGGSIHSSGRRNILMLLSRGGGSGALGLVNRKLQEPLTAEQFMRARVREFRRAARALGVHNDDVVVNDLTDGAITEVDVRAIIDRMHDRHPRASHRTLSYLDPHQDHATAGRALLGAYEDGVISNCRFHVPVPLVSDDLGEHVPLSEEAMAAKRAALKAYSLWRPEKGHYAIGKHSVRRLIREQSTSPMERVHPPGYQG
jgi:LmbE family N-acetylglucosaminyl deacetylase